MTNGFARFGILGPLLALLVASGEATGNTGAPATLPVGNPVKVLLIAVDANETLPRTLLHYENNQVTSTSWSSASTLHHYAFQRSTSFASLFAEMSYGQANLAGDTVLVSLPYDMGDYTWSEWVDFADAEAESLGFTLSSYDRFLYLFPGPPSDAPATGIAAGAQGWCFHTANIELGCIFHELGHTLGMVHGSELQPDGSIQAYGDVSDGLMGSGFNCHVSAVNKDLAGWLTGPRLQTIGAPGSASYSLAPQSNPASTLQVVKVLNRGARPGIGVVDTLVSFRDTNGFDAQLSESFPDVHGDAPANAVLVHQTYRLTGGDALYVQALQQGEVYDQNGVTVVANSISASSATVTVSRAPYDPTAPLLSVTPPNVDSQPWNSVFYTLSITNTNPGTTPFDSLYLVLLTPPGPGWDMGWTSTAPKTVAPGATADFTFWVAPPSTTGLGSYAFGVTAIDGDGDAGLVWGQALGSYTVVGPLDDTPPSAPTGGNFVQTGPNSAVVTWSASTDDLSGVNGYEVLRMDGDWQVTLRDSTGWAGYVDEGWSLGAWYLVRATDRAGNVSSLSEPIPAAPPRPRCGIGFELGLLLPALQWLQGRRRRRA